MIKITKDNIKEIIENNKTVIIDFGADWCGGCVALGSVLHEIEKNYPDVVFGNVDVDIEEELAYTFKVRSIPFVVKSVDGKFVDSFLGSRDEAFLDEFIRNKE